MDLETKQKTQLLERRGDTLMKQAKYKEALDVYEELLQLHKNSSGIHSEEYKKTSIRLSELCNLISMILLKKKEKYDSCALFLKKAEAFSLNQLKEKAVTYKNYACYYRKIGKYLIAIKYLERALELEWKSKKIDTLGDTYLNSCAVLSQLGKHDEALQHVLFAITLLQEEFILNGMSQDKDRVAILVIAYHNAAVQLQFLKRYEQSVATYQKAVKFARKHLRQDHDLIQNVDNMFKNAVESKQNLEKKNQKRKMDTDNERVQKMKYIYKEKIQPGSKDLKKAQ